MRPRIAINLVAFAILGLVMTMWAATSILPVDAFQRPFRVSAEFASSPGLYRDFEVAYLGVRVGKVDNVRLDKGRVRVDLDIDRGSRIPTDVTALVSRKSAIGEPFVELQPPPGGTKAAGFLSEGSHIPLSRTSVPLDYQRLFTGLDKMVGAAPPGAVKTVVHELAATLDGRGQNLRDIIGDANELTTTLANNGPLLDDVSLELTRLTSTLAGQKNELASGLHNFSAVTQSIADSRKDLVAFLDRGPVLLNHLNKLLKEGRPGIGCLLRSVGKPSEPLFTPETKSTLNAVLKDVPTLKALVDDISDVRPEGTYARSTFVFSLANPGPAASYRSKQKLPTAPALEFCPGSAGAKSADDARKLAAAKAEKGDPANKVGATTGPGHVPANPQGNSSPFDVGREGATEVASSESAMSRVLPLVPPFVGAAVLMWVLGAIVGLAPWRRRMADDVADD